MNPEIHLAETEDDITKCWPVLRELRPHLEEAAFVGRVRRQQASGYRLAYIEEEGAAVSAAGFRITEFLAWGKVLYIDDLSTLPARRGKGYAGRLLDWLIEQAGAAGCDEVHLDSGHQRYDAHRLYLNKGFRITSHHFALALPLHHSGE